MAISASTVWEVRTAGSDTNGGGFVTGAAGVDYSQQDTKRTAGNNQSATDVVANGTTTLTSVGAAFTSDLIGNIIYLAGGTGSLTAGWYEVKTVTNFTTITVDRTVASGTGITMNIGGALGSPGMLGARMATSHKAWIKAGTYTITSATTNITGGCFSNGSSNLQIEGYQSSRGDRGTPPLLQASGISSATFWAMSGNDGATINLAVDGNTITSGRGFSLSSRQTLSLCVALNCTNSGIVGAASTSTTIFYRCVAYGCNFGFAGNFIAVECGAASNSSSGFSMSAGICVDCVSVLNTSHGFTTGDQNSNFQRCTAYGNGGDGFRLGFSTCLLVQCLSEGNTGWGYNITSGSLLAIGLFRCASYNNTSGRLNNTAQIGDTDGVSGSGSFFTNAAGSDFTLNNTAGGGAAARSIAITHVISTALGVTNATYPDLGALQALITASGGGMLVHPGMEGGMRG